MVKGISKPSLPDNAEAEIKCPRCGFMFELSPTSSVQNVTSCPQCGESIDLDHALLIDASNEDY
jgi:ribosomal protein S27AE